MCGSANLLGASAASNTVPVPHDCTRFADGQNPHNCAPFARRQIATQISDFPRLTDSGLLPQLTLRCHIYCKHNDTRGRNQRRMDGRDGRGGVLNPEAERVTMSVLRIKAWIMSAACAGLIGLAAGDAHAFCGKLFSKKDACADPCASSTGGIRGWFGSRGSSWSGGDCAPAAAPCGPVVAAPATTMQKIKVTEWVPTIVDETVTVMKPVTRTEVYTAHKWECVPETITSQVTVNKMVTENVIENRCVTERVPVQKVVTVTERVPVQKTVTVMERVPVQKTVTVNETHWKSVMVTEMKSHTVHTKVQVPYCKEVGPSISDRLHKICDPCYNPCPKTVSGCKTERHCQTVCEPVTVCKKVAECVAVTKTVCSYECVPVTKTVCSYECVQVQKTVTAYECVTRTVPTTVCKTRCVPTVETVTKTVNVRKCVAYQATRNVTECVAVQQTIKVTKMVAHVVEKEVAVAIGCGTATGCGYGGTKAGLLDRLKAGFGGMKGKFCGKNKSSGCAAPAACGAAAGCCH